MKFPEKLDEPGEDGEASLTKHTLVRRWLKDVEGS